MTKAQLQAEDKESRCLPIVSLLVVVVLLVTSSLSFWQASLLKPPEASELYLAESHTMQQVMNEVVDTFYASDVDSYMIVDLTWGIKGMDRTGFDLYKPNENRGKANFLNAFSDLTRPGSPKRTNVTHKLMIKVCELMESFQCEGLLNDKLAYPGSVYDKDRPENCWPYHFERWFAAKYPGNQFPGSDQDAYWQHLTNFRDTNVQLLSQIGAIDGRLNFFSMSFSSGLKWWRPSHEIRRAYDCCEELADAIDQETQRMFAPTDSDPESMRVMHTSRGMWVSMVTQDAIVFSLFQGLGFAFPVMAVVVLISTGNFIITLLVVVSITSIVSSVLGFCKWANDWDLGVVQVMAGVMVVGFSVDYCLHLAHMYTEAPFHSARAKVHFTLSKMGGTVLGGAITTFGAGAFLFGTQTGFFQTMASLISVTIAFSAVFSLGFFVACCLLMGPNGDVGSIYKCCCCKKPKPGTVAPHTPSH